MIFFCFSSIQMPISRSSRNSSSNLFVILWFLSWSMQPLCCTDTEHPTVAELTSFILCSTCSAHVLAVSICREKKKILPFPITLLLKWVLLSALFMFGNILFTCLMLLPIKRCIFPVDIISPHTTAAFALFHGMNNPDIIWKILSIVPIPIRIWIILILCTIWDHRRVRCSKQKRLPHPGFVGISVNAGALRQT